MNTNDAGNPGHDLDQRVRELEAQLHALRNRLVVLEHNVGIAPRPVPVAPAVVAPPVAVREVVRPPPLPRSVAAGPRATVTPPPSPPPPYVPAPYVSGPSPVATFLRALHLLPPTEGGSSEVQLGAWWATRIGALVFVIGTVFFGAYLSIGTPPWVKLAELAAVAVIVTLAGGWIERRAARIGTVVEGAGLALCFFTAFAAYAIPAVKVLDSRVLAIAVQAVVVALVFAAAARRQSPTVATMATLLGFVSAFYSVAPGFDDMAVVGAWLLVVTAVVFRCWRGWMLPLGVAAVLAPIVHLAVAWFVWEAPINRAPAWFAFGVLAATFAAVFASAMAEQPGADGRLPRSQHWVQSLHAALAALAGFVTATVLLPDAMLSVYFFAAGGVLAAAAGLAWRKLPTDALGSIFVVKASALLALGVITEWDARTRWMVLLVEAFVLVAAARRMRRIALNVTAVMVWAVAQGFFLVELRDSGLELLWGENLAAVLFAAANPAFLALAWRWWPGADQLVLPRRTALIVGLAAMPAVLKTADAITGLAWAPLALIGIVIATLVFTRWWRTVVPLSGGAVALLCAHGLIHDFALGEHAEVWLWSGAGLVVGLTVALGWRAAEVEAQRRPDRATAWEWLGLVLHGLALAALSAAFFQTQETRMALGLVAPLAALVAWFGMSTGRPAIAGAAVWGLVIAVLQFGWYRATTPLAPGDVIWLWSAAGAAAAVIVALTLLPEVRVVGGALTRVLAGAAAVVLSWAATETAFGRVGATWCLILIAVVYFGWGIVRRATLALAIASVLLALNMAAIGLDYGWPPVVAPWLALGGAFATAVLLSACSIGTFRFAPWMSAGVRRIWCATGAIVAVAFVVYAALQRPAPWAAVTSVIWAAGGIVVFALGLFLRARSQRIAGLALLALCIPRVFLVDVTAMLDRIIAFGVLGAVLIWVGFSYQRFRHLIEDDPKTTEAEGPPAATNLPQ